MFSFKSKGTTRRVTEPKDQSFSTSEINTGTTWIDGSTIYKKTVNTGALNSTDKVTNHGISGIKQVIKMEGFAIATSPSAGTIYVSLPRAHKDNDHDGISFEAFGNNVKVAVGTNNVFYDSYVTIYYTKTG